MPKPMPFCGRRRLRRARRGEVGVHLRLEASRHTESAVTLRKLHPCEAGVEPGRQKFLRVAACAGSWASSNACTRARRVVEQSLVRRLSMASPVNSIPSASATSRAASPMRRSTRPSASRRPPCSAGVVHRAAHHTLGDDGDLPQSQRVPVLQRRADRGRSAPGRCAAISARSGKPSSVDGGEVAPMSSSPGSGQYASSVPMSANGSPSVDNSQSRDADHRPGRGET